MSTILSDSISTYLTMSAVYSPGQPVQKVKLEALERWAQQASVLEAENGRLRALLDAAERVIMAHHSSATHRATPGDICQVCAGEHETVQAIWRTLHQPENAQANARP
jgi:hypothetical protein